MTTDSCIPPLAHHIRLDEKLCLQCPAFTLNLFKLSRRWEHMTAISFIQCLRSLPSMHTHTDTRALFPPNSLTHLLALSPTCPRLIYLSHSHASSHGPCIPQTLGALLCLAPAAKRSAPPHRLSQLPTQPRNISALTKLHHEVTNRTKESIVEENK